MSCYSDADLLTYRAGRRVLSALVCGDQETTDAVSVVDIYGEKYLVPVEAILMHQPGLLVGIE